MYFRVIYNFLTLLRILLMNSRQIDFGSIGTVLFVKSSRARYIRITVRPFTGVRVSLPRRVSYTAAQQFVYEKERWIRNQIRKMRLVEQHAEDQEKKFRISDFTSAEERIRERVRTIAEEFGFSFNRITIRQQKTRWGSCSARNNLSLNLRLVTLPDELMDYVILHELVHTRIKNHSPAFWRELDKYVCNSKQVDRLLRKYPIYHAG